MARYGQSAESAFFSQRSENLRRRTGDLFEERFITEILHCVSATNSKRKADKKHGIVVYPHRPQDANDLLRGTDLKLLDLGAVVAPYAGHLRLDVTHNFDRKDNMPLLATPKKPILLYNQYPLQIGVRVGNKAKAFDEPVIVLGLDATPGQIRDIEERGSFYSSLRSHMPSILMAAGGAVQEYRRLTDPDYKQFLERNPGKIAAPNVALSTIGRGRSEVMSHKPKWYTPFAATARELVSAAKPGTELSPVERSANKTPYLDKLNAEIKRVDERDKEERRKQDIRDGYIR